MPCGLSAFAASIASSTRSPGMNLTTDRRTNAVFVARSRIQAFVDAQSRALRIKDIGLVSGSRSSSSPAAKLRSSEGGLVSAAAGRVQRLDRAAMAREAGDLVGAGCRRFADVLQQVLVDGGLSSAASCARWPSSGCRPWRAPACVPTWQCEHSTPSAAVKLRISCCTCCRVKSLGSTCRFCGARPPAVLARRRLLSLRINAAPAPQPRQPHERPSRVSGHSIETSSCTERSCRSHELKSCRVLKDHSYYEKRPPQNSRLQRFDESVSVVHVQLTESAASAAAGVGHHACGEFAALKQLAALAAAAGHAVLRGADRLLGAARTFPRSSDRDRRRTR